MQLGVNAETDLFFFLNADVTALIFFILLLFLWDGRLLIFDTKAGNLDDKNVSKLLLA